MNNLIRLCIVGALVAFAILSIALGMARNSGDLMAPVNLLLFAVAALIYVLPTLLAYYRGCSATIWIALVNVFLGWTILGWFAAIGWAATGKVDRLPATIPTPPGQALHGH
jgi:hypothetical protein